MKFVPGRFRKLSLRQASASDQAGSRFPRHITLNAPFGRVSMGAGSCCLPLPSKAGKMRGKFKKIGKNKGDSQMVPPDFYCCFFHRFLRKSWTPADPLQLSEQLQLRSLLSPVDFI